MFGYVTIYKPELKVKDYYKYKAYYCGLCQTLKEKYGFTGQMTLTYDFTFVTLLLTSLYESESRMSMKHCKVHPVKKTGMLQNEITEYAAEMNLLLAYYHFLDDWKDERKLTGLSGIHALKRKASAVIRKYPKKCRKIYGCLEELSRCEETNEKSIDKVAGCFGRLMEELFIYRRDQWEEGLRRLAFYLGKFIYIMDAYDDLEKDREKGNYNPLNFLYEKEENEVYEEECRQMLTMMMAECSSEFEKLPCLLDADILRNILYAGVWTKYDKIQKDRKEGKEQKNGK